jgi:hypothetical protein
MKDGRHFDVQLFAPRVGDRLWRSKMYILAPLMIRCVDDCPIAESWESIPTYDRTSPRTDSDAALVLAKGWLEACLGTSHELCISPDEAELPTRVVDTGLGDGVIRLIEPHGQVGSYVCLSHCWGQVQVITTTKSTLQDRRAGIPAQELSNTFRDAIMLTRRLGIQYIWIDSLCIIQDDHRDWEIESVKMNDIYSNSYLTIAATHSHNGRGGLFSDTPDVEISGVTPSGEDFCLFFRERIDHHLEDIKAAGDIGHPTIENYPLLTRAWVYQERMLSTRVLHFGRYELFFECRSDVKCECSGIGWHGSSTTAPAPVTKILHADALDSEIPGVEWHIYAHYYIARLWRTIVSSYTCLGLTKPGDRLPAVGGLAKHMAVRRKSAYLAGLWEDTLSDDLLWSVYTTSTYKKPRPTPRTAPTWSWASVETYVLYFDEILYWDPEAPYEQEERQPYEHFARVEECGIIPAAVDEYGAISKGRLRISGLVASGELEREVEMFKGEDIISYHISFPNGVRLPMKADYLLEESGPDQTLPGTEVTCLRMSRLQSGSTEYLVSLVLRPVESAVGVFERIGSMLFTASPPPVDPVGPVYGSTTEQVVIII